MNETVQSSGMQDIEALLAQSDSPVLVDCYSPDCKPCAALAPVLDDVAGAMDGRMIVEKVDVVANPDVAARFGVRGVPTLLLFQDGALKATRTGAASRTQLVTWLAGQQVF
ncbi:thioredoxin family protein [Cupriavidus sp. 2TAF22]|uniref:thioredoxin family protein n=1 Tax=unclassified Cupriavidus TaxID=2640874 RepID=UPI003F8EB5A7